MNNVKVLNIVFFTGIIIVFLLSWLLPILQEWGIGFSSYECGFKKVVGFPCVLCGLTTSFGSMVRGDIKGSFSANPFGVFLFFSLVCCFILSSVSIITGSTRAWKVIPWKWFFAIALVVAVLSWIYKIIQGGVYGS